MNGPRDATMGQLSLRIPDDLLERYRKWCRGHGTTPTEHVTRFLEDTARDVTLTDEETLRVLERIRSRLQYKSYTLPTRPSTK